MNEPLPKVIVVFWQLWEVLVQLSLMLPFTLSNGASEISGVTPPPHLHPLALWSTFEKCQASGSGSKIQYCHENKQSYVYFTWSPHHSQPRLLFSLVAWTTRQKKPQGLSFSPSKTNVREHIDHLYMYIYNICNFLNFIYISAIPFHLTYFCYY